MSRLNFTPVDKAFTLGSSQIKDTQEEIAQLTKLILESNTQTKRSKQKNSESPETMSYSNQGTSPNYGPSQNQGTSQNYGPSQNQGPSQNFNQGNYMRVGYPDHQTAVFQPRNNIMEEIDYNLMKVVGHPKFDDIVKNYALIHHPEWLLRETVYTPSYPPSTIQRNKDYFNNSNTSYFGNRYQSTVCSNVKNYIIFFISCIIIFIMLSLYFKD